MTAETITATRAASTFPVFKPVGSGVLCAAYGQTTIAAGNLLEAGDVIQFCKVPAGAVVVGGWLYGPDFDTDGTEAFDMDIGWLANGGAATDDAVDADGFGNFGVLIGDVLAEYKPVAGIRMPLQGKILTQGVVSFTRETTIVGNVIAAATAGGLGTLTVVVLYIVP